MDIMSKQHPPTQRVWHGSHRFLLPAWPHPTPNVYTRWVHVATGRTAPLPVTLSPPPPNQAPTRVNIRLTRALPARSDGPDRPRGPAETGDGRSKAGRPTGCARSPPPRAPRSYLATRWPRRRQRLPHQHTHRQTGAGRGGGRTEGGRR
jgi:hypothetical protein